MRIVGIDPGPRKSAVVTLFHDNTLDVDAECPNESVLSRIQYEAELIHARPDGSFIAIEDMTPYGSPLSYDTIATLKWMGKFDLAASEHQARVEWITRVAVKQNLLGVVRGTDAMVSDCLCHYFGREGGIDVAKGTKRNPGPLFNIKGHAWAALAVAVVARNWRAQTNTQGQAKG